LSYRKTPARAALVVFLAASLGGFALWACGPFFPNWLLNDEAGILEAPTVWLRDALQPLLPTAKPFTAVTSASDPSTRTAQVDEASFQEALASLPADRRSPLLDRYRQFRQAVTRYGASESPRQPSGLEVPTDLPAEFADYLQGAIAYHEGRFEKAGSAWERLLARPAAERRYRSTWAAYMLGRSPTSRMPARRM
jgi:hypothetical protein